MRMWAMAVCLVTLTTVGVVFAQGGRPAAEVNEQNFGTKVIGVTTHAKSGNDESHGMYLGKAKVRRLGDRYFVVGEVPDLGEAYAQYKGTVVWISLSDIALITEFANVESVQKAFHEMDKAKKEM